MVPKTNKALTTTNLKTYHKPTKLLHKLKCDCYMRFKYCIKFNYLGNYRTKYVKARTKKEALIAVLNAHKVDSIKSMEIIGEPLPTCTGVATYLTRRKKEANEKKRKERCHKYYALLQDNP